MNGTLGEDIDYANARPARGTTVNAAMTLQPTVHLALDLFTDTRDASFERIVVASLDRIGWGGLYDGVDGGFFRRIIHGADGLRACKKLLDVNAALVRIPQAGKHQLRGSERAAGNRYIQTWLADPVDGGSSRADDIYYLADTPETRRAVPAPP